MWGAMRTGAASLSMIESMTSGEEQSVGRSRAGEVRDFARSELFERTFQEGMDLVEEAAAWLDGDGRRESKLLSGHGPGLCGREHEADHAPDAGGVLAPGATRGA